MGWFGTKGKRERALERASAALLSAAEALSQAAGMLAAKAGAPQAPEARPVREANKEDDPDRPSARIARTYFSEPKAFDPDRARGDGE